MTTRTNRLTAITFVAVAVAVSMFTLRAQLPGRGSLPLVPGDAIPSVSGFTEEGSAISLESLKGQPTVIAFGCLT